MTQGQIIILWGLMSRVFAHDWYIVSNLHVVALSLLMLWRYQSALCHYCTNVVVGEARV